MVCDPCHWTELPKRGFGAGGSPDVSWRRWPAVVVVEEDPFLFFEDSAIVACFSKFWSAGFVENWKRRNLSFVWSDLDNKWESYEDLKFGEGWASSRRKRKKGFCARKRNAAFIDRELVVTITTHGNRLQAYPVTTKNHLVIDYSLL